MLSTDGLVIKEFETYSIYIMTVSRDSLTMVNKKRTHIKICGISQIINTEQVRVSTDKKYIQIRCI